MPPGVTFEASRSVVPAGICDAPVPWCPLPGFGSGTVRIGSRNVPRCPLPERTGAPAIVGIGPVIWCPLPEAAAKAQSGGDYQEEQ
jgi:hypothetical protein